MQEELHNIPDEIGVLITDYLNGVISDNDLEVLTNWLSVNENNRTQFNLIKTAWITSARTVEIPDIRVNQASARIISVFRGNRIKRSVPFWTMYKIAASWLIFMIIGYALNTFLSKQQTTESLPKAETTITSPIGSRSVVDLPDGTKVWLNAGSSITYNNHFGIKKRKVQLTGEAYFDVKSNEEKPFYVKTPDILIKALGTKFNVKAYPEEKVISATLEEGIIEVTCFRNTISQKKLTLKPKDKLTILKKPLEKEPAVKAPLPDETGLNKTVRENIKIRSNVSLEPITSWKDAVWIVNAQPLGLLAPILERRYNVKIEFDSDEIKYFKFTGKIQNETIEQIMIALELSAPIRYEIEQNHIELMIDKNRINQYKQNTAN